MAKKKSKDALEILHKRYYKNKPKRLAALEVERDHADVAAKIYKLRTDAGLSQRDLARLVKTSAAAICRLENADYEGHSLTMLRKIAKALNKKVEIRFVPLEGTKAA